MKHAEAILQLQRFLSRHIEESFGEMGQLGQGTRLQIHREKGVVGTAVRAVGSNLEYH